MLDTDSSLLNSYSMIVSDNINVKGFQTSAGTAALRKYKPLKDADVIGKLKTEGAFVIGN